MLTLSMLNNAAESLPAEAKQWLQESIDTINASSDSINDLLNCSASARRQCGDEPALPGLSATEIARLSLISAVTNNSQSSCEQVLKDYYRYGDEHEKATLLKGLDLLDPSGQSVQLAINACRVNSLLVFCAIALNNPYPAKHFPELNWNQLVLKSLFQKLDIAEINCLNERLNSTLSSMCADYAQELVLADRIPPNSTWLAIRLKDLEPSQLDTTSNLIRQFISATEHEHYIHQALVQQLPLPKASQTLLIDSLEQRLTHTESEPLTTLLTELSANTSA